MKYQIIIFGCQINKNDSQRISAMLQKLKFSPASEINEADLIVINVCSVRQSAVDRAIAISQKLKVKSQNHNSKVKTVITGCILKKDKERFQRIANAVLDVLNIKNLPQILKDLGFQIKETKIKNYLKVAPKYDKNPVAYVAGFVVRKNLMGPGTKR